MNLSKEDNIADNLNELETKIIHLINNGELDGVVSLINTMHSSDSVIILERLPKESRDIVLGLLDIDCVKELILWFPKYLVYELMDIKGHYFIIDILKDIDSDDESYAIVHTLEQKDRDYILNYLSLYKKDYLEKRLSYPQDSAGRLMHSSFVSALPSWSVEQTLKYLKNYNKHNASYNHSIYDIFIVEESGEVISSIPIQELLFANHNENILSLKSSNFRSVHVNEDQEKIALLFRKKGLSSLAVVDDSNILLGVILVDDIVDVVYSETQEDFLLSAGINVSYNDKARGIFSHSFLRLKWLLVNFIEALTIPLIVLMFKETIEKHVIITAIVQFVVALGGNAGGQSLSITIRGLALNLISTNNAMAQVTKEVSIAFINGTLLGIVGLLWGYFLGDGFIIGVIAFCAVLVNVIVGTGFGVFFPMIFEKFNIDPAVASSICVTTSTDIAGFFLVLLIATILL